VDDIIFGGSSHTLVSRFQEMRENEFQMSMMGELTFFLGIQVKQTKEVIFIHQAKCTKNLMKKFNMAELKPVSTPMSTAVVLDPDENGEAVDQRVQEHDHPSCTSRHHDRTFSSPCAFVHAFKLPHALHIERQFSESSCTSNTLLSLRFGILLLLHLILLGFPMLISRGVGLTERALLVLAIFSDLLLYVGQFTSSLLLHSPAQRPNM
jgi:hypothetical protein